MKFFGSSSLETVDLETALEFRLTRASGWVDSFAGPVVVAIFFGVAWYRGSTVYGLIALLALIGMIFNWAHGRTTILRIGESKMVARGNLESWFTTEMVFDVNEITSMGWSAGGEGDSGGIYISRGFVQSWVLPGVTEEQGRDVMDAVSARFPHFPVADRGPASILFGNDSGIVVLGLAEGAKDDPGEASQNPPRAQ